MSRLFESSLTGKISNALFESEKRSKLVESISDSEKAELRRLIQQMDAEESINQDIDDIRYIIDSSNISEDAKQAGLDALDNYDGIGGFIDQEDDEEGKEEKLIDANNDAENAILDYYRISRDNLDECDKKDIKPIEKTRDELIRDHGTDNVDLINAGKEAEEKVALKESLSDEIADFMADLDPYGYNDAYEGDEAEKHKQAVADIENDKEAVKSFLQGIVDYEESTPDMVERAKYFLGALNESVEEPNADDLAKDEEKQKEEMRKGIEDKIAELRLAIQDGVSDDEKEAMEKEIADLEGHLDECNKVLKEDGVRDGITPFNNAWQEAHFVEAELRFAEPDLTKIRESVHTIVSNLDALGDILKGLTESVSVATSDGSSVNTDDAASIMSNGDCVSVDCANGTTVTICSTPASPVEDVPQEVPVEEPIEEIPAEEIPTEEPVVEPEGEEVIEEADDDYSMNANVDAKSLAVLKNQGPTYMLQIEESNGKTSYWVCDNFNSETNEGDNAEVYFDKAEADKAYFKRVGLDSSNADTEE